jgi:hypothetical protein
MKLEGGLLVASCFWGRRWKSKCHINACRQNQWLEHL